MTSPSKSRSATATPDSALVDLRHFLDESPTPHHVVESAAKRLLDTGFTRLDETSDLPPANSRAQRCFIARHGALVAFVAGEGRAEHFRIVGAHTDSPGLHLKMNPEGGASNFATLEVEIYGSPLLNSWLDRDLEIAGHVVMSDGSTKLFRSARPLARISQLAIHLDRSVNDNGLVLDKHAHLRPVWASGLDQYKIRRLAADLVGVSEQALLAIHAQLVDVASAQILGIDESLLASGRLDNQLSCWAAIDGLRSLEQPRGIAVAALFDHEEVGSVSATGAQGPLLEHLLERIALSRGQARSDYLAMLPRSTCLSCDNAHAVHPNYPERHDPKHAPLINSGVALKTNANQRYATTSSSAAAFIAACNAADVRHQTFHSRNNMPCGSTIGPITAARLGIDTVDVGVPQLSMHSAREVCGVSDALDLPRIVAAFLAS